jgi:hypothetical protein
MTTTTTEASAFNSAVRPNFSFHTSLESMQQSFKRDGLFSKQVSNFSLNTAKDYGIDQKPPESAVDEEDEKLSRTPEFI